MHALSFERIHSCISSLCICLSAPPPCMRIYESAYKRTSTRSILSLSLYNLCLLFARAVSFYSFDLRARVQLLRPQSENNETFQLKERIELMRSLLARQSVVVSLYTRGTTALPLLLLSHAKVYPPFTPRFFLFLLLLLFSRACWHLHQNPEEGVSFSDDADGYLLRVATVDKLFVYAFNDCYEGTFFHLTKEGQKIHTSCASPPSTSCLYMYLMTAMKIPLTRH